MLTQSPTPHRRLEVLHLNTTYALWFSNICSQEQVTANRAAAAKDIKAAEALLKCASEKKKPKRKN
jgi:hypothetical protein